jgi:hypothetical protein
MLPSAPAILKVFVMVISLMITELVRLREQIYRGIKESREWLACGVALPGVCIM